MSEHRRGDSPARSFDYQSLFVSIGGEVPARGADDALAAPEVQRHRILDRRVRRRVRGAAEFREFSQQMIEQIENVAANIEEEPAAGLSDVQPPEIRRGGTIRRDPVIVAGGDVPEPAGVDDLLHLHKARQGAPIVGDEQRKLGALEGIDHPPTFDVRPRHRLLDVTRLPRRRDFQRILQVRPRRRGDVDDVNFRIRDQRIGVVIKSRHLMPPRVILRGGAVAAHHRNQSAVARALQRRTALDFGDIPAADDAPADRIVH